MDQKSKNPLTINEESTKSVFVLFCLWTFVLLCRPQNYISALLPMRPALLTTAVMIFITLIYFKKISKFKLLEEKQVKLYFLLVTFFVLSIPTAVHVRVSFNFIFLDYIISFLFFVIFYTIVNSLDHLIKVIYVTCAGCGIYCFMASLGGGAGGRLFFSTTFDPNDLAYFTLVFLPLNIFFIARSNHIFIRLSALSFIVVGLMLIFLSQSRGGFLALGVSLIILFLWSKNISKAIKIALFVIGALTISLAPFNFERFFTLMSIEDDYNLTSPTGRIEIWKTGLKIMIDNPLTGVGVGNFARAIGYKRQEIGSGPARWQSPHNSLIEVGTEAGFFALGLYLYLSFNALRIFVRGRNQTREPVLSRICELLVLGFVGMFTAAMFLSQAFSLYWVFYIALSAVINQMLQRQMKERVAQRALSS